MLALDNAYTWVSLESGMYDHAIRVIWKQPVKGDVYIQQMKEVGQLFQEHPSFSVMVADHSNFPELPESAFAWLRQEFLPQLSKQVSQLVLGYYGPPEKVGAITEIQEVFERGGILVHRVDNPKELQRALAIL